MRARLVPCRCIREQIHRRYDCKSGRRDMAKRQVKTRTDYAHARASAWFPDAREVGNRPTDPLAQAARRHPSLRPGAQVVRPTARPNAPRRAAPRRAALPILRGALRRGALRRGALRRGALRGAARATA